MDDLELHVVVSVNVIEGFIEEYNLLHTRYSVVCLLMELGHN